MFVTAGPPGKGNQHAAKYLEGREAMPNENTILGMTDHKGVRYEQERTQALGTHLRP